MAMNLKLAFRRLFSTPLVSAVAILSLALGIGANAAIFSLFNQTLLQALPVERPDELVNLSAPGPKPGSNSCGQALERHSCARRRTVATMLSPGVYQLAGRHRSSLPR